jgi:hypothetical protein
MVSERQLRIPFFAFFLLIAYGAGGTWFLGKNLLR